MPATDALPRVLNIDPPCKLPDGLNFPRIPYQRETRLGLAWFRECPIPLWLSSDVKALWNRHKVDFLRRGYSVRVHEGKWYLSQWIAGDRGNHTLTPLGAEKLATALNPPKAAPIEYKPVELELPPLPHGLEDYLYDYQRPAARQLYRAVMNGKQEWGYPGAWDCSDLGTGKTFSSLAAALATGLEVGVICPKSVIGTYPKYSGGRGSGWYGAFSHFKQKPLFILNYESLRTGNREWVRKTGKEGRPYEWTCDPEHTILIWDESHLLKNKSWNRSMAFAALRQGFPAIFVSGTMAAAPTNLGATGVAVGLHGGDAQSYEKFLLSHGCTKVAPGSFDFPKGPAGAIHLAKIHRVVFPHRGARIRIADLGDRFPETQILCEAVETEDVKAINAAWQKAQSAIDELERAGKDMKLESATAYMEAWHASERVKVPTIVEMTQREIEEGRSVAVFVNFTDVREALARELKTQCMIYGGQPAAQRDNCISDFQGGAARVIICNIKAGGVGISLHDVDGEYPRTAIILPTNNAVEMGQALGRVHRAGGKSRSRQLVLFAAGSVEEQICESTRRKLSNIAALNDGDLSPQAKF